MWEEAVGATSRPDSSLSNATLHCLAFLVCWQDVETRGDFGRSVLNTEPPSAGIPDHLRASESSCLGSSSLEAEPETEIRVYMIPWRRDLRGRGAGKSRLGQEKDIGKDEVSAGD